MIYLNISNLLLNTKQMLLFIRIREQRQASFFEKNNYNKNLSEKPSYNFLFVSYIIFKYISYYVLYIFCMRQTKSYKKVFYSNFLKFEVMLKLKLLKIFL